MRRSLLFISSLWVLCACTSTQDEPTLEGCWVRSDNKQYECWESEGNAFTGQGLALTGHGDTTIFERLSLYTENGVRIYAARVGQDTQPILFTETDPWVFENPEHDFPKKISYEFKGSDTMKVTVGDGQLEGFTWVFSKPSAN